MEQPIDEKKFEYAHELIDSLDTTDDCPLVMFSKILCILEFGGLEPRRFMEYVTDNM